MLVTLRVTVICLFVYYYFDVVVILYTEHYKLVRTSQQATGSNRKPNEASGNVRKLQEVPEAPGSLKKHQEVTKSK